MINIAGEPFIFHQIKQLINQRITEIFICLGHLGEIVEKYIRQNNNFGITIHFIYDGKNLLGTGGCIKAMISKLPENFFILYGDSYLDINYFDVYNSYVKQKKSALLTVFKNKSMWDSSNVEIIDNSIKLYSKSNKNDNMEFIDYGLSLVYFGVFEDYKKNNPFDLSIIFENLSKRNDLACFEAKNRFYEIGSKEGIIELDNTLNK